MPKISVIIPAHNEEAYLEKTLQSLRSQNFLNYETIVVCNGCEDNTEEVAKRYLNQTTRIFSLNLANVSLARNHGAEQASGDVLLFLDADTILEEDSLSRIDREFNENFAVATTKTKPDVPKLKYKLASAFKNIYNQPWIYQGCSGALICRKDGFHQVRGYPEIKVKEHRKLIIKLKKKGKYKLINTYAITSMRRFERWGLAKVTYFWVKEWVKNYFSDLKKSEYEKVR
ncbi:MAG: glycosyltransferase family 2 protein [Candidatus Woesearchaeota archaeon]